ncbi:daptide-type RiPP biosynthesis methyltransferase [Nonomuraea sp. NPDC050153]|uniref:daptide-type RiPP biosynthesis methyltransferase n=1 Tax=Nonomuraea sp. NPDC050153 TaxID=3364359 RepID=UPI00379FC00E
MTHLTDLPSQARQLLDRLGDRAVVCDLYDRTGSPVYHDLAGTDTQEVRELVALVRRVPGPVLDLAAGSGRLTLPLLALGREVTAVDLSEGMLSLLAARLEEAPARLRERCTLVRADMRTFSSPLRFAAIVLGTSSISLLDAPGRTALYGTVRAHLAPGGRFVLSTIELNSLDGTEEVEVAFAGASGRSYRFFERWDPDAGHRVVAVCPAELPEGPVTVCTSTIGVVPADLLEAELARAGFALRSRHALTAPGARHRDILLEAEVAP